MGGDVGRANTEGGVMIEVARKELCEELEKLSGWKDTAYTWKCLAGLHTLKWKEWFLADYNNGVWSGVGEKSLPAYDLGYLMRKLPFHCPLERNGIVSHWFIRPNIANPRPSDYIYADTPEDVVALLCIELFKQNVLKREDK